MSEETKPSEMTLRDYFASKYMQSAVSTWGNPSAQLSDDDANDLAKESYQVADAMINASSK